MKVSTLSYKMKFGVLWFAFVIVGSSTGEKWKWPDGAATARIDNKIGFVDHEQTNRKDNQAYRLSDEAPFQEPIDTEGFYNRPPGAGRYPVRVEGHQNALYQGNAQPMLYPLKTDQKNQRYGTELNDGTLDSQHYCKCLATPECNPRPNSEAACGVGRYLCCYKRPNTVTQLYPEYFNEVEDERPMLLPGKENLARPFPPPAGSETNGYFGSFDSHNGPGNSGAGLHNKPHHVAVGPDGPTGVVGPQQKPAVLVGPGGPTGIIGPVKGDPLRSESAQRGVLVGPGGPTGIIGPAYGRRPILVGPGGPTGIIGPGGGGRRPILVGPDGPTGIIGPAYNRQRFGVLTGPGGLTGINRPERPILVGPDGPTGQIGPQGFYGF